MKQYIKNNYPNFYKKLRDTRLKLINLRDKSYIKILLDWLGFRWSLLLQKPYYGDWYFANQIAYSRQPILRELLRGELEHAGRDYKILEIGTWAGGASRIFALECKKRGFGKVYCIDHWLSTENMSHYMNRGVKNERIYKLFLYNMRTSGISDIVIPMKGSSDDVTALLQDGSFHFIFIDGDHRYVQCKKDMEYAKRLVKIGGIICGDDLELLPHEADMEYAKKNYLREDMQKDLKTNLWYHPGVTLAVHEVFGEVGVKDGVWAVRKTENGFEKILF